MNFDLNFFLKLTKKSDQICELKISSDLLYNSDLNLIFPNLNVPDADLKIDVKNTKNILSLS